MATVRFQEAPPPGAAFPRHTSQRNALQYAASKRVAYGVGAAEDLLRSIPPCQGLGWPPCLFSSEELKECCLVFLGRFQRG